MPSLIWLRSAILHSDAASMVARIFAVTVSTAARIATFGSATPSIWARSIAFCTVSTLSSRVGSMLIATSVMSSVRGSVDTSATNMWLTRRSVRIPVEQSHLGQFDARALDLLGRRQHLGRAADHLLPVLVGAQAVEDDVVVVVVVVELARRRQRDGDRVAQATWCEKCSVWSM